MANHKSALKRNRQNERRRVRNRVQRSRMRTAIKKVRVAISTGDFQTAENELKAAAPLIQRMGARGLVHKKMGARTISRLTRSLNQQQQQTAS